MNLYTIHFAECLNWLEDQRSNNFHAVVTDPPYGLVEYTPKEIENHSNRAGIWRLPNSRDGAMRQPTPRFTVLTTQDRAKLRGFTLAIAAEFYRILTPGAHVFWATHPLFSHIVSDAFVEVGFEKRGEIIRTISTLRGGDRPKGAHKEFSMVTVLPRSCWEPWVILRKPITGRVQDCLRRYGTGALRRISEAEPFRDLINSGAAPRREKAIAPHPSLKPQAFLRRLVSAVLPLGKGVVLDPFMGSGSTIAAATRLGIRSVGVEKNKEYFQMARLAIPKLARITIDNGTSKGSNGQ